MSRARKKARRWGARGRSTRRWVTNGWTERHAGAPTPFPGRRRGGRNGPFASRSSPSRPAWSSSRSSSACRPAGGAVGFVLLLDEIAGFARGPLGATPAWLGSAHLVLLPVLGGACGALAHALPASTAGPGVYALVGMGAFFAASAKAPATSVRLLLGDDLRLSAAAAAAGRNRRQRLGIPPPLAVQHLHPEAASPRRRPAGGRGGGAARRVNEGPADDASGCSLNPGCGARPSMAARTRHFDAVRKSSRALLTPRWRRGDGLGKAGPC